MSGFVTSRLSGTAPLETVFWRDMLAVGTAINMAAAAAAFTAMTNAWPGWLGILLLILPIPWNLFLGVAVWRSAEREGGPAAITAKVVTVIWVIVMTLI